MSCRCSGSAEIWGRQRSRAERGAVTAELALGLPVLMVVTLCLVWFLSLGLAEVRCVDGAREAARALARGDDPGRARSLGLDVAGDGSRISITRSGSRVSVRVSRTVRGFFRLADHEVSASAVAEQEDSGG